MRVFPPTAAALTAKILLFTCVLLAFSLTAMAQAQATAADLSGTVSDPTGAVVAGATVSATNLGTNITRTVVSASDGDYQFIGLPPGDYQITAQGATFKKVVISPVKLTVGQSAELAIRLEIGAQDVVVNVSGDDVQLIETTRTAVSNTIDQARINNLPINERSATGFALTISTVGRDNGRPVGPAPTSGLNIGGQRGRSTLVQVDGADFTDNSINAARSTVSQEAVQEFQVTTNSYMPEFGRATGGIINVVTKRGGSHLNGNVFGFLRDKSFQARNAFAPVIDNDPKKRPPYTRVQYGFTLGGPIIKEKTFFFGSFEQHRRQESGFFTGDIVGGATSSVTINQIAAAIPGGGGALFTVNPFAVTFSGLTAAQAAYVNSTIAAGMSLIQTPATFQQGIGALCVARTYAYMASVGSQTALNGASTLPGPTFAPPGTTVCPLLSPLSAAGAIGNRFLLSGAPVPLTRNANGQYIAFRPLAQLQRIFPISEATTYSSLRIDHAFNSSNQMNVRVSYNPSLINGIQDESQNQTLGQNDYSRTGIQDLKDTSFGMALTSILPHSMINEAYFNYGRRVAKFDSQVPSVALQIAGTGFIGSNPFSPVSRTENRYQIRDNMTYALHSHTIKFGADFNWINGKARFDLNFPGLFNFSSQSCSSLITGCAGPAFTPVQTYGLGFPSVFIQGFGDPNSTLSNKPIAFFAQDTWKVNRHLTLNYGIRYDYEFTQQFAPTPFRDPLTGITLTAADVQTAQDALNVTQGFPRDSNNWAPRLGLAYDVMGDGKTVIRAAAGIFYDHPLLAVSFNSNIADGSQQQQATLLPIGGPASNGLLNAFQVFHGTVCGVQGSNPALCTGGNTQGVASSAEYLYGQMRFNPSTFTGFGPVLPFTLNVSKDFQYPQAVQMNFAIERQLTRDMSFSAAYIGVHAHFLAHPQDVNNVNSAALIENFRRFAGRAPNNLTEAAFFSVPTASSATYTVVLPGLIAINNATGQRFVSAVAADFFRTLGPNYFFANSISSAYIPGGISKASFDAQLAGTVRTPGPINPYADVNAQLSDGNSSYDALNLEFKKRFSNNIQFYATYTWSHSIDDSSDLQTLLKPQDNTNFRAERSDSLFDQRHRFVFSGIIGAPDQWRTGNGVHRFMHGFVFAPIIEVSSGRPFNIIAPGDANGDFQSTNERPYLLPNGQLCQAQNTVADTNSPACVTGFPINGNLGRNMGLTHPYFSFDARLTKKIRFGERVSLDLIAEGFNLFNRFNEAAANPFYTAVNAYGKRAGNKFYSSPTSAFDPRQFQFGAKINF
jgi:Carboxypeptidase regulatory-like domain/TonB dependent receptor